MKEKLKDLLSPIDPDNTLVTEDLLSNIENLFNTAVDAKVADLKEEIKKELEEESTKELSEFKEKLTDTLDKWLDEFSKNYVNENLKDIKTNEEVKHLKTFFENLMGVFKNHNVMIPESDTQVIKDMEKENENLKEEVNQKMEEIMKLKDDVLKEQCKVIFKEGSKDLTETQIEKLKKLMEDVEFFTPEIYSEKLTIMKENFLDEKEVIEEETIEEDGNTIITEGVEVEDQDDSKPDPVASKMSKYL